MAFEIHPPKTNIAHETMPSQKGKDRLPTINFQVLWLLVLGRARLYVFVSLKLWGEMFQYDLLAYVFIARGGQTQHSL